MVTLLKEGVLDFSVERKVFSAVPYVFLFCLRTLDLRGVIEAGAENAFPEPQEHPNRKEKKTSR